MIHIFDRITGNNFFALSCFRFAIHRHLTRVDYRFCFTTAVYKPLELEYLVELNGLAGNFYFLQCGQPFGNLVRVLGFK